MSRTSSALLFIAVIAAATLAVYLPGLDNELIFDDGRLTDGTIFGQFGSLLDVRPRMLSYSSFVWIKSLFGGDWWKQRLVNVVLHVGVAAGLYGLFMELAKGRGFPEESRTDPEFAPSYRAAVRVGVALFALNPVAVYAVAYLVQRSIVMATLFVVLACLAWVRGLNDGKHGWLALAALFYLLAVMSKEAAITAAVLAVPLYVFVARPTWKRIVLVLSLTLLVLAGIAAVLFRSYGSILGTVFDESSRLYVRQLEALQPGVSVALLPLSILNQAALFFQYGLLWFLPNVQWMSIDLRPAFPLSLATLPQLIGAIGFVVLLAGSAWLLLRRRNLLGFLGLCLLIPMLLYFSEFGIVWVQDPFVLYRSYLWAIALPGLVALPLIGFKPRVIYPVGVVLAVVFGGLAVERSMSLKSEVAVWTDAAEKIDLKAQPNAVGRWRPFLNRGAYYLGREMTDYAYNDFARAEALGDPNGSARFNMGVTQQMLKRHEDALALFAKAEATGFTEPVLYYHRAESLQALGRFAEAYESYTKALAGKPDAQLAKHMRVRRAEAALMAQKYDPAMADFNAALKDNPSDERALMGLGMAYVGKEDSPSALAVFNRLLAIRQTAAGYYGRAMAYVVGGDKATGLKDLDQAIALEPKNTVYQGIRTRIAAQK